MINNDILRIMHELRDFTSDDLAAALEITRSSANQQIEQFAGDKLLESVRVGHSLLWTLTARGLAKASKMPAIDTGERCLPLSFDGVCPEAAIASGCCPDWRTSDMVYVVLESGGMIGAWQCPHCGHLFPVAVYNEH